MAPSSPLRLVEPVENPGDLYVEYGRYVAGLAYRLLGRDGDVDDVVQDVFLAALTGLSRLRDRGAIKGWLASTTVNVASRRLRRRKLLSVLGFDGASDTEVEAPGASAEERMMLAQVYEALDEQPVNERVAWVLRHVEGESLERVAELTACSLATAKRRISAAQAAIDEVVQ